MPVSLLAEIGKGETSYTIPAGSNRLLVGMLSAEGSTQASITATSYTLNGVALTKLAEYIRTSTAYVGQSIFYMKEADMAAASGGTFDITWSATGLLGGLSNVFVFEGVDQTTPFDSYIGGNSTSGALLTLTLPTTSVDGYTAVSGVNSTDTATHALSGAYSAGNLLIDVDDGSCRQVRAAGASTGSAMSILIDPSSGTFAAAAVAVRPLATTAPTVTDAGDETFFAGESITITGADFGASQGQVIISPSNNKADALAVQQTITSWGDTSVIITATQAHLLTNAPLYLFVQNVGGTANSSGHSVIFKFRGPITPTTQLTAASASATGAGSTSA